MTDYIRKRQESYLRGEGPDLILDAVAFFAALGFEPDEIPEVQEQIRRDRERLVDEVRD